MKVATYKAIKIATQHLPWLKFVSAMNEKFGEPLGSDIPHLYWLSVPEKRRLKTTTGSGFYMTEYANLCIAGSCIYEFVDKEFVCKVEVWSHNKLHYIHSWHYETTHPAFAKKPV